MKELTKAEEQIMQVLWKLKEAFVKEIIEELPTPKPAYNTVSTIVRILEKKGFVSYHAFGKTHRYFPLLEKEDYTKTHMNGFVKNYFSNSFEQMVSFFAKEKSLSIPEMEEIQKIMANEIKKQQNE
ncbi:MAG: BlaI/MecI/CopY family transcriptional regulator [Bacteroidetes bacterium]|nr:MAG: BlaI/MecI/CopY family transcriptional regulator [Bacteroidota bacterium]